MKEPLGDAINTGAKPSIFNKATGLFRKSHDEPTLPRYSDQIDPHDGHLHNGDATSSTINVPSNRASQEKKAAGATNDGRNPSVAEGAAVVPSQPGGDASASGEDPPERPKRTITQRFLHNCKSVILHSWVNVLLVFVPVGIAVEYVPGIHGGVVFAINCIAIVPLAGLLSHATESVAVKLGDTVGALLNVTFGNAVELIIL